jgi:hypothetical protein
MSTTETDFYGTINRAEQLINVAIRELTRHAATLQNRANIAQAAIARAELTVACDALKRARDAAMAGIWQEMFGE